MSGWGMRTGIAFVRLTSADIPGSLLAMEEAGIMIRNVTSRDVLCISFEVDRVYLEMLQRICAKRGEDIQIIRYKGWFLPLFGLLKRPVLVVGILLLLLLSFWAPQKIFFVQVEGNQTIPSAYILEKAAECGIGFGASRREIRSEKMKNTLLQQLPQLQWAGVNTSGCVATITVLERQNVEHEDPKAEVSSIVASRDGIVRQIITLEGNALCKPGQAVKAGQTLISGYTDCGLFIRAGRARGEIFAETFRSISAYYPRNFRLRINSNSTKTKYSLIIGKKRINFLNNSGISDSRCVRIYSEKYMALPGGFVLPIAVATETWIASDLQEMTQDATQSIYEPFVGNYLQSTMIAGSILSASESWTETEEFFRLDGIYSCYEMIGITQFEERFKDYENH